MKINFGSGCGEELARPMATHQSNRSELDLVLIELRASHSPLPLSLTILMWLTAEHPGGTSDVSAHISV